MAYISFSALVPPPSPTPSPEPSVQGGAAPEHSAQEGRTTPSQATGSSSARLEPPPDPIAHQAQQRRASEREAARVLGTAGQRRGSPPIQKWDMNETVIRQLEKILGTSLSPKSPAEKAALRQALGKEIEGLTKYLEKIKKYQDRAQQPNDKLSLLDGRFCPHVTAMDNARQPDLGLEYFDDIQSFIIHLQDSLHNTSLTRQVLVRCGEGETSTHHHVPINIVLRNGTLSLICLEPAPLHADTVRDAIRALDGGLRGLEPHPYVWSYLSCNAQTSSNDCVPFGQSFAKQMKDELDLMDEMHEGQIAGNPLRTSNSPDEENALLEEAITSETHNMHQVIANAHTFMPLRFLEHTNSINSLETWMKDRSQDENTPVIKASNSYSPQGLLERARANVPRLGRWMLEKTTFRKTTHHYNASIEEKRKEAAEKTLELFQHIEKTLGETD